MINIANFINMGSAILFIKKMDELPYVNNQMLQPKDIYLNKISRVIKNIKPLSC
jgi:hypothetical protein